MKGNNSIISNGNGKNPLFDDRGLPIKPSRKYDKVIHDDIELGNGNINNVRDKGFQQAMKRADKQITNDLNMSNGIICYDINDENELIRFFVSERVYGFPSTNGKIFSNYISYFFNNHPFFSIFLTHSKNPYTKWKRFLIFLCTLFFAISLSFVLEKTYYIEEIAKCREGCNKQSVQINPDGSTTNICIGGFNDGISYDEYNSTCKYYRPWYLPAIVGIVLVPYGSLLRFFATCSCFQGRDLFKNYSCCTRIKGLFECCGGQVILSAVVFNSILLLATIIDSYVKGYQFDIFIMILQSKLWSFMDWVIWTLPYFAWRYPIDRRYFYNNYSQWKQQKLESQRNSQ